MPLSALIYFYRRRLRTHPVQELLAGIGVAVGVALVFAVLVANGSITGASAGIVHGIAGSADLQLRARGPSGMDERLADRVRALRGVRAAVPVLALSATARGPSGHELTVQVLGAATSLASIGGPAYLAPEGTPVASVVLPSATAQALGISAALGTGIARPRPPVSLRIRGRSALVAVTAVLGPEALGALSNATAVIAPLPSVQDIGRLPRRISEVLVQSAPGAGQEVRRELKGLAADRMTVASANNDISLLQQATVPNGKATGFFAFVSALVGLLLAFNAMLLSAPERRRMIADLRVQGARRRDLVKLLLFQAVCLGLLASLAGVLAGDLLSRTIFHQTPGYLAAAFPLGTQTVIGWQPVLLSMAGGILATCMAAAPPLLDLRRSRSVDAVYFEAGQPGHAIGRATRGWLLAASLTLVAASAGMLVVLGPTVATVGAVIGLALAAVLAIPFSFTAVVWLAQLIAARARGLNMLLVATRALRATTVRSLALAATGAVAVFGSVAAEGAHTDLLNGLYRDYAQYVSTASVWVTSPRDYLATSDFPASGLPARLARISGVAAVRTYEGGFFDLGDRRAWVIARAASAPQMVPAAQITSGDAKLADSRLRGGGWITLSAQIARAAHVSVGQAYTLPTPSGPVAFRLAAMTTNLGWTGGAIVLNLADYARAWGTSDPSAIEVQTTPGVDPRVVTRDIERQLGADNGLSVQTGAVRAARANALAREGLSRLTQIALLLMVAAALAMAAAMGASIWQRRASLASLRIQSFRPSQLRLVLLCESALVLLTGAIVGAAAGLGGHALIDRYLRLVTGFPAPFSPAAPQALETIGVIVGAALLVLALPGYAASRAPARLALQE